MPSPFGMMTNEVTSESFRVSWSPPARDVVLYRLSWSPSEGGDTKEVSYLMYEYIRHCKACFSPVFIEKFLKKFDIESTYYYPSLHD